MEKSVFTKIIEGEIPCYKVYEDNKTFAFLDNNPLSDGHTLVVSKKQVDKFYNLDKDDYDALFSSVKKIANNMERVLGVRIGVAVEGFEVAHAHIHLVPLYDSNVLQLHHGYKVDNSNVGMEKLASKLYLAS